MKISKFERGMLFGEGKYTAKSAGDGAADNSDAELLRLEIRSSRLGRKVVFTRPGKSYIFVDLNNQSGTLGVQPLKKCGATLSYSGNDQAEFSRVCKNWFKLYIKGSCAI